MRGKLIWQMLFAVAFGASAGLIYAFNSNQSGGLSSGGTFFATQVLLSTNASYSCPAGATYVEFLTCGGAGAGAGGSNAAAGSGGQAGGQMDGVMLCANGPFNAVVGLGTAGPAVGVGAACSDGGNGGSTTVTDTPGNFLRGTAGNGAKGATSGCTVAGTGGCSNQISRASANSNTGFPNVGRFFATACTAPTIAVTTTPGVGGFSCNEGGNGGGVGAGGEAGEQGYIIASFF